MMNKHKYNRILQLVLFRIMPLILASAIIPYLHNAAWLTSAGLIVLWIIIEAVIEDTDSNNRATNSAIDSSTRQYILFAHFLSYLMPGAEYSLYRVLEVNILEHESLNLRLTFLTIGASFLITGIVLRIVAVKTLGKYFTGYLSISPEQEICNRGIYKYIRHPGYTALIFLNVGTSIVMISPISFIVSISLTLWSNRQRVIVEEDALIEKFGETYRSYTSVTPRWLPFLPEKWFQNNRIEN